jgi:hypothetical protein
VDLEMVTRVFTLLAVVTWNGTGLTQSLNLQSLQRETGYILGGNIFPAKG